MREPARVLFALLSALTCLGASMAAAEDEPWSLAALGVKGTAIIKNFSHFETTATDPQNIRDEGILRVEVSRRR